MPEQDANWLFEQLRNVQSALTAERIVLQVNSVRSARLRVEAGTLTQSQARDTALRQLNEWDSNQRKLAGAFDSWERTWQAAIAQARGWLATVGGVLPPDLGELVGVGAIPWGVVVPVVVGGAVILAVTYAVTVHKVNDTQTRAIEAYEETLRDMMQAKATPAQLAQVSSSFNRASAAAMSAAPDLFGGLTGTIQTFLWIAAAAMLLPAVLPLLQGRRR